MSWSKWTRRNGTFSVSSTGVLGLLLAALIVLSAINLSKVVKTTEDLERVALDRQWDALQSYIRLETEPNGRSMPLWYYDPDNQELARAISRLRKHFVITDERGEVLSTSFAETGIPVDSPAQIRSVISTGRARDTGTRAFWETKHDTVGRAYLVRSGILFDTSHRSAYYVAIAAPAADHIHLTILTWIFACTIVCALLLGWFSAKFLYKSIAARTACAVTVFR